MPHILLSFEKKAAVMRVRVENWGYFLL